MIIEVQLEHREFENGSVLKEGRQCAVECLTKRKGTGVGESGSGGGKSGCSPPSKVERVPVKELLRTRKSGFQNPCKIWKDLASRTAQPPTHGAQTSS